MVAPDGAAAIPIEIFVVKIVSRCNLNCSYCYMYNLGDGTWRGQPKTMKREVYVALAQRVREHVLRHGHPAVCFILHGGEPLMAGRKTIADFVAAMTGALQDITRIEFRMQTNGTLLNAEWLDFLAAHNIGFGISLDGPPEVNDRFRRTHRDKGSSEAVERGIRLALAHPSPSLFGSVLCVVDPNTDPLATYRYFRSLGLRGADFLLPDATWDTPPAHIAGAAGPTPYADWLMPIFDAWFEEDDPKFRIRHFETIIERVLGGTRVIDSLGGGTNQIMVVETDGGLEPVDVLKVCGHGFTKLGLNVLTDQIDDLSEYQLSRIYVEGGEHLCGDCKSCPIVDVCGGGYLPHRYRSDNGFDNRSVYCADLMKLIRHIREKVRATIPAPILRQVEAASSA